MNLFKFEFDLKLLRIAMLLFGASIAISCSPNQASDYENLMEWARHPKYWLLPYLGVFSDSLYTPLDLFHGNDSIPVIDPNQTLYCVYPDGHSKGIIGKSYPLFSATEKRSVTFDFKYKTEHCSNACIHIYSVGDGEIATEMDSIPLPLTNKWKKVHRRFAFSSPCFLHVELEVTGDTEYENLDRLFIDQFMISSGGKSLKRVWESYPANPVKQSEALSMESLMTQSILDKKILGLGETTHGTVTLQDIAFDIMKERILHHSCSLILFEMPLEESFAINRYVKNDERFHLEDVEQIMGDDLYSDSVVSFLQWVKKYNQSHDNVVSVFGVSASATDYAAELCLIDFIEKLDGTNNGIWHSLCRTILTGKEREALAKFDADGSIQNVLTAEETGVMRYCIENLSKTYMFNRLKARDESMQMNIRLLTDLYQPPTVTIHAHFGHLNYVSNVPLPNFYSVNSPSAGYSLKQTFKDEYACIALASASGNTFDWFCNHTIPLEVPPLESLEQSLSTVDVNPVFLPMVGMSGSDWYKMRWVGSNGNVGSSQFADIVPKARMDGIIVVRETVPIPSRLHTPKEINDNLIPRFFEAVSKYPPEQKANPQK